MGALYRIAAVLCAGSLVACAQQPVPRLSASAPASTRVPGRTSTPPSPVQTRPASTPTGMASEPLPTPQVFSACPLPPAIQSGTGDLRLVYVLTGDIWLVDEGKDPVLVTDLGDVIAVKLASDDQTVLFTRAVGDDLAELWTLILPDGEPLSLSGDEPLTGPVVILEFSDDREYIAFLAGPDLWAARLDGTGALRLVSASDLRAIEVPFGLIGGAQPTHVAWIPDSHRLTYIPFLAGTLGDAYLYRYDPVLMVDAETGEQGVFLTEGSGGYLTYSPDRTKMAVVSPTRLSLQDLNGYEITQASLEYPEYSLGLEPLIPRVAWSADSTHLLAAVPADSPKPAPHEMGADLPLTVWKVSADGSSPVTIGQYRGSGLAFSPDLSWLAYLEPSGVLNRFDLLIANLETGEETVYERTALTLEFLGWAPDSRHFAYLADGRFALGHLCESPLAIDIPQPGHSLAWLDGGGYLLLAGPDGALGLQAGSLAGELEALVVFGDHVAYDYRVMPP